jgi:hypothetical protein
MQSDIYQMNFLKPRIKKHYCLWLTFKNDEVLENAIKQFAIKYDAPLFKPHISISKDHSLLTEREFKSLNEIARSFEPFEIETETLLTGHTYFQSHYFSIKQSEKLDLMASKINSILDLTYATLFPHISLIYGQPNIDPKSELNPLLKESFKLTVDAIQIMEIVNEISHWRPLKIIFI